jgi:hypothetical protein
MHKARLYSLKQRHAQLEAQLHAETSRPYPDLQVIQRLKKEKLAVRDQMTTLTVMQAPAAA